MEWVYRFFRRHTRPVPRYKARFYYDRLSFTYYMFAWSAAGVALFTLCTDTRTKIPDNLNIYAEDDGLNSELYRAAARIQIHDNDVEVKVINVTNFKVTSVHPYMRKDLLQQHEDTRNRSKEDFFGNQEEIEEQDSSM